MKVHGTSYSPVDDARFKSGIPSVLNIAQDNNAVTLRLYDIHFDPAQVNLNGGNFDSLDTIVEEVAHTVQFLQTWAKRYDVRDLRTKLGEALTVLGIGQLLVTAGTSSGTAPAPSSLAAAPSSGGGNVILSWSAAAGATNYRVERKGVAGSFILAGTTASTGLTDTGVSAGSAYLYRVCTANGETNCTSVFSNIALGAAIYDLC